MDSITREGIASLWSAKSAVVILAGLLLMALSINNAHSAWFKRLLPKNDTYTVKDIDIDGAGEEVFVIDDFIYDARETCDLSVGDKVLFAQSQYGIDYRATVYTLHSNAYCELLLRDPVSQG